MCEIRKYALNSVDDVKNFVSKTMMFLGDVTIKNSHYIVDGKSLMGIFSLDLSKPIFAEINAEEDIDVLNLIDELSEWEV